MKRIVSYLFLGVLATILSSCSSAKQNSSTPTDLSGEWVVTGIKSIVIADVETQSQPAITFDIEKQKASGSLSCNQFFCDIETTSDAPGRIKIHSLASTRMACSNMEVESEMSKALTEANRYEVSQDGTLTLYMDEIPLMTLVR